MRQYRAGTLVVLFWLSIAACKDTRAATFPNIDRDKVRISLARSGCFGTCPDYKVTIDGRGHVTFSTREESLPGAAEAHRQLNPFPYVVAPGKREYDVDLKTVDDLIQKFRDANFFSLKDEYSASITDNPTYVLEIDTGNGRKRIVDYVGRDAGMPPAVSALENAVDQTAGSDRWVFGADGLVEGLAKEGFDFRSEEAARMLLRSIERGGDETHVDLIARGAPLDLAGGDGPNRTKNPYGVVALLTSIRDGRAVLFAELVSRGWLKRSPSQQVADVFVESGAGCQPAFASKAHEAGIPIDVISSHGSNGLTSDGGETALAALSQSYSCRDDGARVQTASRLLELGADPNHRNDAGQTAIFGVENLELLNLLLAHGADAKALDKIGNRAIFETWTDDVVLRLLQAGASPKGSYDGKTLWQQMSERPMPKVKAWLASHPAELIAAKSK